jgi:hypothetical protein
MIQDRQREIDGNYAEVEKIGDEIEATKAEATENILKIVKLWREDQKEKIEMMSSDLTSIGKQSNFNLQVPISINLSSSSESKSDEK